MTEPTTTAADLQRMQLQRQLDSQRLIVGNLYDQRAEFEQQVRNEVIDWATKMDVDTDKINGLLESLDLDPVSADYEVLVTVVATQRVTMTVRAANTEAARSLVSEGQDEDALSIVEREVDQYNWSVTDYQVERVAKAG